MEYVKLTDMDGYSRRNREGETLWRVGQNVAPIGEGQFPCGPGVIHAYESMEHATIFNPLHAQLVRCRAFRIASNFEARTDRLKCWIIGPVYVVEELEVLRMSILERTRLAIRCAQALAMPGIEQWDTWASNWLSGVDRTIESARQAEKIAVMDSGALAAITAVYAVSPIQPLTVFSTRAQAGTCGTVISETMAGATASAESVAQVLSHTPPVLTSDEFQYLVRSSIAEEGELHGKNHPS